MLVSFLLARCAGGEEESSRESENPSERGRERQRKPNAIKYKRKKDREGGSSDLREEDFFCFA
jgi:hypothetical protein